MERKIVKSNIQWQNVFTIILVLILCLWRIPFLDKGIDYTDTGYSLENYRNVFGGNGIQGIGVFLITFIGGVIYRLLPAYQLLVFRILHWILGLLTYYFAYLIFKRYLDKRLILLLLIAISFIAKSGEAIFSYYPMTSCLLLLSLLLLHDGLIDKKKVKIILAGLVAGMNVFVRLPNLLFLSMFLCILLYCYWSKYNFKSTVKMTGYYIGGVIVAFVVVGGLMFTVLGIETVVDSFMGYVRLAFGQVEAGVDNFLGIEEKSGHSLLAEIKTIGYQVVMALTSTLLYIIPILVFSVIINYFARKIIMGDKKDKSQIDRNKRGIDVAIMIFVALSVFIIRNHVSGTINHIVYLLAMGTSFIFLFLVKKKRKEYRLIFSLTFLMGCCSVIGSDAGLSRISIINSFLILSLALGIVCLNQKEINNKILCCRLTRCFITDLSVVLVIALYVVGIFCVLPVTYCDANFGELRYTVNSDIVALKGMKTSKIRSEEINEYYELMSAKALQDKEVAIFGYFPLGIIIGNQEDYFESVQPCIDYPGVNVESLLEIISEKNKKGIQPVIVVSYVNQIQRGDDHYTSEAKMAVLNYMLSMYDYTIYSQSEYFSIYVPAKDIA